MAITPTSQIAIAIDAARKLVARSTTFQSRCATYHKEVANETNALTHVYTFDAANLGVDDLNEIRPYAVVAVDTLDYQKVNPGCARVNLSQTGGVLVIIEDTARFVDTKHPNTDTPYDSYYDFLNFWGGVMDDQGEMFAVDNKDEKGFDTIELVEYPNRPGPGNRASDDFWTAIVAFHFDNVST